jgi:hypothetical protein
MAPAMSKATDTPSLLLFNILYLLSFLVGLFVCFGLFGPALGVLSPDRTKGRARACRWRFGLTAGRQQAERKMAEIFRTVICLAMLLAYNLHPVLRLCGKLAEVAFVIEGAIMPEFPILPSCTNVWFASQERTGFI